MTDLHSSDFNPLAPCGARPADYARSPAGRIISILSPRAGRDPPPGRSFPPTRYFNPLAPCGARQRLIWPMSRYVRFQSSRPVRGETCRRGHGAGIADDFNPLAPCGARRHPVKGCSVLLIFQSSRPVRGETDKPLRSKEHPTIFQSSRPVRGETIMAESQNAARLISILSPRAGRDGLIRVPR